MFRELRRFCRMTAEPRAAAGDIFSISIFVVHAFDARIRRADGYFMDRTVPSADPKTVWLTDLIEAAEELAACTEPCDPAIVRAFRHRLELPPPWPSAPRSRAAV